MFDTTRRPQSSFVERLSLALTLVAIVACFISGAFALRGTARMLAAQAPAHRASEVLLHTNAMSATAERALCVDSTTPVHYAPSSSNAVARPDGIALR